MPEGQVSYRNATRLSAALAGRELVRVEIGHPALATQDIPGRLAGDRIKIVEARGKHHLVRFASGRVLHSHLGMVGRWRLLDAERPLPRGDLWLALVTERHVAAQYRGPRLRLYEPGRPIPGLAGLGPDLLAPDVDPGSATAVRLAAADPDRPVVDAIADQRVVAGIGNAYRSETLFLCGVDPFRPVGTLSDAEARAIGATAAALLADGAASGGPITTYRSPDPRSRERTWGIREGGPPLPAMRHARRLRSHRRRQPERVLVPRPASPDVATPSTSCDERDKDWHLR